MTGPVPWSRPGWTPRHRRNIEDCSLTTIGVGPATDGYHWTQDSGR
ncbi:hypothetical protein LWC35_13640 [Pseudonocardia kujensis]|nr:hypothetical protein [Pseudonocardia kujensis]MCE0763945.1 hypothetical protein [Pseudonocardia kujensis]